ncbi:MAG: hypothetical protein ACHQ49_06755 [Elusimicrobiota bacterium]
MNRRIALSALAAALFYGLDSVHVRAGIWKARAAQGVPWWYAIVYFLGILLAAQILRAIDRRYGVVYRGGLALDIAGFVGLLAAHLLLFKWEGALAAASVAYLLARLVCCRRPGDILAAALLAGIEAGIEWGMLRASLFSYAYASPGPLPLWLLPFWGGLVLSIRGFFLAADSVGA